MPKLICDKPLPEEQVAYYTIAGLPNNPQVTYDPTGEYGLVYELKDLAPGNYSVQVSACNAWQCSLPAPLEFIVPDVPSTPRGLSISYIV